MDARWYRGLTNSAFDDRANAQAHNMPRLDLKTWQSHEVQESTGESQKEGQDDPGEATDLGRLF